MTPKEVLLTVLSDTDANDVIEHRRVTIKKPLTTRSAQILVKEFQRWGDPAGAVEIMIAKCWQGFNADWAAQVTGRRLPRPTGPVMMSEVTGDLLAQLERRH